MKENKVSTVKKNKKFEQCSVGDKLPSHNHNHSGIAHKQKKKTTEPALPDDKTQEHLLRTQNERQIIMLLKKETEKQCKQPHVTK